MDISSLLAEHANAFDAYYSHRLHTVLATALLFTPLLAGYWVWSEHSAGEKVKVGSTLLASFTGAMIGCFFGIMIFIATAPVSPAEIHESTVRKATEQVNTTYGTDIPEKVMWEAMLFGDHGVVMVDAHHDGEQKSLTINFNKEAKTLTVLESGTELTPSR